MSAFCATPSKHPVATMAASPCHSLDPVSVPSDHQRSMRRLPCAPRPERSLDRTPDDSNVGFAAGQRDRAGQAAWRLRVRAAFTFGRAFGFAFALALGF